MKKTIQFVRSLTESRGEYFEQKAGGRGRFLLESRASKGCRNDPSFADDVYVTSHCTGLQWSYRAIWIQSQIVCKNYLSYALSAETQLGISLLRQRLFDDLSATSHLHKSLI